MLHTGQVPHDQIFISFLLRLIPGQVLYGQDLLTADMSPCYPSLLTQLYQFRSSRSVLSNKVRAIFYWGSLDSDYLPAIVDVQCSREASLESSVLNGEPFHNSLSPKVKKKNEAEYQCFAFLFCCSVYSAADCG